MYYLKFSALKRSKSHDFFRCCCCCHLLLRLNATFLFLFYAKHKHFCLLRIYFYNWITTIRSHKEYVYIHEFPQWMSNSMQIHIFELKMIHLISIWNFRTRFLVWSTLIQHKILQTNQSIEFDVSVRFFFFQLTRPIHHP